MMLRQLEPWLLDISEDVRGALDLANLGFVNEGLQKLVDCESTRFRMIAESNSEIDFFRLHALYWVKLQRATVLSELASYDTAREILEDVLASSKGLEHKEGMACFCKEYVTSSIELAKLSVAEGQISSGIILVKDLLAASQFAHFLSKDTERQRILFNLNTWGDSLGYDDLSKKMGDRFTEVDLEDSRENDESHWSFPIPLRGRNYSNLETRFQSEVSRYRQIPGSNLVSQYEAVKKICEVTADWISSVPYSVVAREYRSRFAMFRAELELRLNLDDSFLMTMEEANEILGDLLEAAPEDIYLQLNSVTSLVSLGNAALYNECDDEETSKKYYAYGFGCIQSAQSVLESIFAESELTQAVALSECLVLNMTAIMREMTGEQELAERCRAERIVILNELLKRDPGNDLAARLKENYRLINIIIDPEIEEEIGEWNWSVTPLDLIIQ